MGPERALPRSQRPATTIINVVIGFELNIIWYESGLDFTDGFGKSGVTKDWLPVAISGNYSSLTDDVTHLAMQVDSVGGFT